MNSLANKMQTFADEKNKCETKIENCLDKDSKHCGKGENVGIQHFLLFPRCFKSLFSQGLGIVSKTLNPFQ